MSRLQRLTDDYAKLLAENATLRLTGNENAVNCDAHTIPIAFIPANGPCPACELQAKLDSAMAVVDAAKGYVSGAAEVAFDDLEKALDELAELEKGDVEIARLRDALAKAMALLREMDSYASNRWEDTIDRLEKGGE